MGMKTNFPMVVQLTVNDVKLMTMFSVMTVKTQLREPNKSPLVSASGLNDTSQPVLASRAKIFRVDWRIYSFFLVYIPRYVDPKGRIRRVWPRYCPQKMLLGVPN